MSPVLAVLIVLLIVMATLPIAAAVVLWKYRTSSVASLRERSELAQVLAFFGFVTALLALNRLIPMVQGEWLAIAFILVLLLVDLASGRWLWQFWLKSKVRRWRRWNNEA